MVKRPTSRRSVLALWPVVVLVALAHIVISVGLFAWQAPLDVAGLPTSKGAVTVLSILCFPMQLLGYIDSLLPQRFRVPELLYPITWALSSVFWKVAIATLVVLYRKRRQDHARTI